MPRTAQNLNRSRRIANNVNINTIRAELWNLNVENLRILSSFLRIPLRQRDLKYDLIDKITEKPKVRIISGLDFISRHGVNQRISNINRNVFIMN
jgi:hypothetical protein